MKKGGETCTVDSLERHGGVSRREREGAEKDRRRDEEGIDFVDNRIIKKDKAIKIREEYYSGTPKHKTRQKKPVQNNN